MIIIKELFLKDGLNDAYITYEMIVEGGETRLMALFKGKNIEKIGPIRSSRQMMQFMFILAGAPKHNLIYQN